MNESVKKIIGGKKYDTGTAPLQDRVRIKLVKNTKDYGWEITAAGETVAAAVNLLCHAQAEMSRAYGDPGEEEA